MLCHYLWFEVDDFISLCINYCRLLFGISASRVQGIEIRKSRAGRRTLNKIIDYLCYILLGAVIGKAIGEPYGLNPITVSITIMVLCYCFEIDSIYGHICILHGIKKKYSIWSIFWKLLTFKFKAVGEAFQDMKNQSKEYKSNNNNNNEDTLWKPILIMKV